MGSLSFIPFLSQKQSAQRRLHTQKRGTQTSSGGHPPAPDAPEESFLPQETAASQRAAACSTASTLPCKTAALNTTQKPSRRTRPTPAANRPQRVLRKIGLLAVGTALCVGLSGCWEKKEAHKADAAQNLLRTPYYIFGPLEGTENPAHPAVSRQTKPPAAPEAGEERLDNLQIVYALPDRPQRGSMVLHNMNLAHRIQKEPDLSYLLLQDPGDGSALQLRYMPSMAVRGQGSSLYVPATRDSEHQAAAAAAVVPPKGPAFQALLGVRHENEADFLLTPSHLAVLPAEQAPSGLLLAVPVTPTLIHKITALPRAHRGTLTPLAAAEFVNLWAPQDPAANGFHSDPPNALLVVAEEGRPTVFVSMVLPGAQVQPLDAGTEVLTFQPQIQDIAVEHGGAFAPSLQFLQPQDFGAFYATTFQNPKVWLFVDGEGANPGWGQ